MEKQGLSQGELDLLVRIAGGERRFARPDTIVLLRELAVRNLLTISMQRDTGIDSDGSWTKRVKGSQVAVVSAPKIDDLISQFGVAAFLLSFGIAGPGTPR